MDSRQDRSGDMAGLEKRRNNIKFRALRHASRLQVEGLETRQLLSGVIADVGAVSASPGSISAIVKSTDGNVWLAQGGASISKLSSDGTRVDVSLPAGNSGTVSGLTTDSSGALWYARGNSVGKITMSGSAAPTATEYALPNASDKAGAETLGSDGNVYTAVTTSTGMAIAKVDSTGKITEIPLSGVSQIGSLTSGPDGNLWFVDGKSIAKTTLSGQVTHYTLPARTDGTAIDLSNAQLVAGAGNKLWFLGLGGISSITTDGTVKTYPTPSSSITSMTFASDGNLWFSFLPSSVTGTSLASTPGAIVGRMTQDGQITLLNDRGNADGSAITAMTPTKDGSVWADEGGKAIAKFAVSSLPNASNPIIRPTTAGYVSTDSTGAFNGPLVSFAPNTPDTSSQIYKASIDWGDGQGSVGTVAKNVAGDYTVLGIHNYAFPANTLKGVIVTIQDAYGNSAQIFNTVKIKPPVATVSTTNNTSTGSTTVTGTSPSGAVTTTTTTTAQPGTPVTAGSVKSAIMQVLKSGGTNAQALAAGEQTALALQANRLAGINTVKTAKPTSTTVTGTTTTGTSTTTTTTTAGTKTTAATRREMLVAARAAAHHRALAHPRGPMARRAKA